jgi:hypothetical protein
MSFPCWIPPVRRVSVLGAAALLAASLASAQSNGNTASSTAAQAADTVSLHTAAGQSGTVSSVPAAPALAAGESSSLQVADSVVPAGVFAEAAAAGGAGRAAAGQEYGGGGGIWQKAKSNFAFEAGGGFNAPAGDKSYITWGGQLTVGGGVNFNKHLALLAEYQFIDDKLPGRIISEAGSQGGHVHLWSLTLDPVLDLFPKSTNDVYVTGGGGFYRKVTSFTEIGQTEYCYFYCEVGYVSEVVGHFSSNQGGFNVGAGFQHRLGGMYGDSKTRLFAEARFVEALTPAVVAYPNGLAETTIAADTKVIPVSVGVRW